jgi:hypothetical protein
MTKQPTNTKAVPHPTPRQRAIDLQSAIAELREQRRQLEVQANYQLGVIDGRIAVLSEELEQVADSVHHTPQEIANGQAID